MTPPVSTTTSIDAGPDRETVARWAAAGRLVQSRFTGCGDADRTTLSAAVPQQRA